MTRTARREARQSGDRLIVNHHSAEVVKTARNAMPAGGPSWTKQTQVQFFLPTSKTQRGPLDASASSSRKEKQRLTLHRFTRGLRLSRLASTTMVRVVLGSIIAFATPNLAQSSAEQIPSASEETKDASGAGKDPVANPISTLDHTDSIKDKAEATKQDGANPWGQCLQKKPPWLMWPLFCCPTSTTGRYSEFQVQRLAISGTVLSLAVTGEGFARIWLVMDCSSIYIRRALIKMSRLVVLRLAARSYKIRSFRSI